MTTGITISFGPATARSRHITNRMPRRARAGDGLAAALKRVVKSVETTLGAVITEAEGQDLFDVTIFDQNGGLARFNYSMDV